MDNPDAVPAGRRVFLKALGAAGLLSPVSGQPENLPPVLAITRGPKFHWFGYYDKLQFDPSGRAPARTDER